jgi:hypothetical protein
MSWRAPWSYTQPPDRAEPSWFPISDTVIPKSSPNATGNHRYHHTACQKRGPHDLSRMPCPAMGTTWSPTVTVPVARLNCS